MIALITDNLPAIEALCRQYGVQKLAVFGSAVTGTFSDTSDIDFMVDLGEYERGVSQRFLGLYVDLEHLLGRSIDLVTTRSITSTWFRDEINRTAVTIHERRNATAAA